MKQQTSIWLNDVEFPIIGHVEWRDISPFAPEIRLSGPKSVEDYSRTEKQRWGPFTGGMGIQRWRNGEDDRIWQGFRIDTAQRDATLSPLQTKLASFGTTPVRLIIFTSKLWAIAHNNISYWNTSTSAWVSSKTDLANPTDACVITDRLTYATTMEFLIVASAASGTWKCCYSGGTYNWTRCAWKTELWGRITAATSNKLVDTTKSQFSGVVAFDRWMRSWESASGNNYPRTYPWGSVSAKDSNTTLSITDDALAAPGSAFAVGDSYEVGSPIDGTYVVPFGNRLYGVDATTKTLWYSGDQHLGQSFKQGPASGASIVGTVTGLFVGRDVTGEDALYILSTRGVYLWDTEAGVKKTDIVWEEDSNSGKCALYHKGAMYFAQGMSIWKVDLSNWQMSQFGPDSDDGLPGSAEAYPAQGYVTAMIGVGNWIVIAVSSALGSCSCVLKRHINGVAWHQVFTTGGGLTIGALAWLDGTLYTNNSTDVYSCPFSAISDNQSQLSTSYVYTGDLILPWFDSPFETMTKVAHKVWAITSDGSADEYLTFKYITDNETYASLHSLGSTETSPVQAKYFPSSSSHVGIEFKRIQLYITFYRNVSVTTRSPKVQAIILEYSVIPPVLRGWTVRVDCRKQAGARGKYFIDQLDIARGLGPLLVFYPTGSKEDTARYVRIAGRIGVEEGGTFGQEGVYVVQLEEVIATS